MSASNSARRQFRLVKFPVRADRRLTQAEQQLLAAFRQLPAELQPSTLNTMIMVARVRARIEADLKAARETEDRWSSLLRNGAPGAKGRA